MVEVTLEGRLATTRKDTGGIESLEMPTLRSCGPSSQRSGRYRPAIVGDGVRPLAIDVLECGLAGQLGQHGAVTLQVAWGVGEAEKRLEGNHEVGSPGLLSLELMDAFALEQIEGTSALISSNERDSESDLRRRAISST